MTEFDRYLKWRDQQACIDCGAKFSEKGDAWWVTETQCCACYERFGPPEKRGLPNAADLYTGNLDVLQGRT